MSSVTGALSGPSPQRRLAEFATILGDFKLAVTVWESMRKEGRGGSVGIRILSIYLEFTDRLFDISFQLAQDILPLLLTPAPTIQLHVSTDLSNIHPSDSDPPAHAQLRAVLHAVRWEAGIAPKDFTGSILEGEKWLVWAGGKVCSQCPPK